MTMVQSEGLPGSAVTVSASEPYYRRIMADIRARIASGEWSPGHRLPSTTELRERYAVEFSNKDLAMGTVRQAITWLLATGELRGQQGKGVYVAGSGDGGTQV